MSPIASMACGLGPMKTMPASAQARAKLGALGEEAEARMHGLGAGLLAGGDDLLGHQVGLRGRRRADQHGLVGHLDGEAAGVGLRIDHDRGDPEPAAGADDAHRDLAAVGDQDFGEQAAARGRLRHYLRRVRGRCAALTTRNVTSSHARRQAAMSDAADTTIVSATGFDLTPPSAERPRSALRRP